MTAQVPPRDIARYVGRRLREVRESRGMTFGALQEQSRGRWKAAAAGTYERGQRSVTVENLAGMAEFYGTPLSSLLPPEQEAGLSGCAYMAIRATARRREEALTAAYEQQLDRQREEIAELRSENEMLRAWAREAAIA